MELIDWLQHWDEMRFYYWSGLSWLVLLPVYLGGFLLLGLVAWLVGKVTKRIWAALVVVVVLLPVLAIAPWWEELGIAYNFGQLCEKDAGIVINKTVEVEGYYDATAGLWKVNNPVLPVTAENFDKQGYRFYEMSVTGTKGGPTKVAHFEKVNGVWIPTILDQPTARYHYKWPNFNNEVGRKIWKNSEAVVDAETEETLAVSVRYGRQAPWFFVGLDRPGMSCPRPGKDPLKKPGALYRQVLRRADWGRTSATA